ncbi:MAG: YheV family putative metal-binding protein [Idiomarina sp.]|nr:YheV family putative metal-binding protein [Idiomarina sp.]
MTRTRKRFIAGATCPECKAQDSMMLFEEGGKEHVHCVECGYQMSEPEAPKSPSAQPETPKPEHVIGIFKPD